MTILETKIWPLQSQLNPIKESQQYLDFNNRINKKIEKVDRDTQKKKKSKNSIGT